MQEWLDSVMSLPSTHSHSTKMPREHISLPLPSPLFMHSMPINMTKWDLNEGLVPSSHSHFDKDATTPRQFAIDSTIVHAFHAHSMTSQVL